MNWKEKITNWYIFNFKKASLIRKLMEPYIKVAITRAAIEAQMRSKKDMPSEEFMTLKAITESYTEIEQKIQDAASFLLTTKKTPNLKVFFFDLAMEINAIKVKHE